ncbi:MAG: thioredoxin domain-containing protein [Cyanobacteria bacterium P01_D01_bin.156]
MVSSSEKVADGASKPWFKGLIVGIALMAAIIVTLFITRPAATSTSFAPLSGLVTLKAMANESVAYGDAIASEKPIFLEFYADWCTTCQGMSGTIADLHQTYGNNIEFVMLDIDDPQWAPQVLEYGASGVPQFTLLNGHHEEVNTWVGKVPKPILANVFEQLVG